MACIVNREPEIVIQEVEVEKIVEIEKEVIVEVEPTYVYNITPEEREMLARLVFLEGNLDSLECQKAIVSTVMNRLDNGYWGDNLHDVIYSYQQFTPANQIKTTTPNNTNYEAVDYVLRYGSTLPSYVLYFRSKYHFNWEGYEPYGVIGGTYFGYFIKDKLW